jgi:hypothetical protein
MTRPGCRASFVIAMKAWIVIFSVPLLPTSLWAQTTATNWPGLDSSHLSTVYVVDHNGTETTGRLLRFDPDSLVLLVDGTERRFEAARIGRIDKRGDSLRNGVLIGAIVGAGVGSFTSGFSDCPGTRDDCPGARIGMFVGSTAIYTAIGTAIDALVTGRTTLYVAPKTADAGDPTMRPADGMRVGFNVRVTW